MSSFSKHDEFSTHAVPTDARVASFRVAAVASMVSFSLPTFIAGIEVSSGVGPDLTVAAILGGALVIFLIGWLMGSIGARTGFNSYLLVRLAFGDAGARVVNLAFSISLLGWFGINLNLFGLAIAGLSDELFGIIPPELLVTIVASLLITVTTIIGFRAINLVSTLMIPVLAFVAMALLVTATSQTAPVVAASQGEMSLGDGISAIVGSIVIGSIIMPDITRFLRTSGGALLTSGISYMIAQPFVMWVAASAAMVLGTEDIISIMLTLGLGLGAFVIIIAGSWVLNALNLYSAVLGVTASFPRLSARVVTVVLGVIGVTAGLMNILDSFVTFLFYLSVVFIPVAGVIIVDHFIARPEAYRVTEVEDNQPLNRWGLLAWFMGAAIALAASEGFIGSVTRVSALDAMLTTAVLYWIAARLGWVRQ
ncbi:MAG: cytosine permease [Pseudomonadota bacterium]|nr:cytosine permease [Pseudomonadota bacterium]